MLRRSLLLAGLLIASTTWAAADFALDIDQEKIRKDEAKPAVADLGVGEKGYVKLPLFCSQDGTLQIVALSSLVGSNTDYGAVYELRRDPNNRVAITVMVGTKSATTIRDEVVNLLTKVRPCDALKLEAADRLTVSTINGKASTSELLAH